MTPHSYSRALLPDQFRVARMTLQPHCLGHAVLLQRLGSPYAGRPREQDGLTPHSLGSIALAVWLCRRRPDQALRSLNRLSARVALTLYGWRIYRYSEVLAHEELTSYLLDAWPEISWWSQPDVKSRTLGAELILRLGVTLARHGATPEQSLGVPLAVVLWHQAALSEENGSISIVSERDKYLMEQVDRATESGLLPAPGTVINRN